MAAQASSCRARLFGLRSMKRSRPSASAASMLMFRMGSASLIILDGDQTKPSPDKGGAKAWPPYLCGWAPFLSGEDHWYSRVGSNHRPPDPQSGALTN